MHIRRSYESTSERSVGYPHPSSDTKFASPSQGLAQTASAKVTPVGLYFHPLLYLLTPPPTPVYSFPSTNVCWSLRPLPHLLIYPPIHTPVASSTYFSTDSRLHSPTSWLLHLLLQLMIVPFFLHLVPQSKSLHLLSLTPVDISTHASTCRCPYAHTCNHHMPHAYTISPHSPFPHAHTCHNCLHCYALN